MLSNFNLVLANSCEIGQLLIKYIVLSFCFSFLSVCSCHTCHRYNAFLWSTDQCVYVLCNKWNIKLAILRHNFILWFWRSEVDTGITELKSRWQQAMMLLRKNLFLTYLIVSRIKCFAMGPRPRWLSVEGCFQLCGAICNPWLLASFLYPHSQQWWAESFSCFKILLLLLVLVYTSGDSSASLFHF